METTRRCVDCSLWRHPTSKQRWSPPPPTPPHRKCGWEGRGDTAPLRFKSSSLVSGTAGRLRKRAPLPRSCGGEGLGVGGSRDGNRHYREHSPQRLICAFKVSSTTRSNEEAFGDLSRCAAT